MFPSELYTDCQVYDVHTHPEQKTKLCVNFVTECHTCSRWREGGGGFGGGWYQQALFAVLVFAFVARFTATHGVMSGVTA